ncbi:MAG: hypothetical protein DRI84_08045 [Bacteroidetes bacterium]|nr:MAG: hypothetical protein DRI84_08045 [Bacteroidota bacterium]
MKRLCENCTHLNCYINKYTSDEWKPFISHYKSSFDYPAGVNVFSAGDAVKGIYQIYSGKVKIVSTLSDGRERIVRLAKTEQFLGHRGFGGSQIYPVSAITLTPAEITFIPIDIFYKSVKANPDLAISLLNFYADDLREMEKRMEAISIMNAKEKVALALMIVIQSFGFDAKNPQQLSFTPSRKDLAGIAGTTYETVVRMLSEFDQKSIIKLNGKSITIIDEPELKRICNKYYDTGSIPDGQLTEK